VARKIVRWSYDNGWSERRIVKEMYALGIPSPTGKALWAQPVIRYMLANPLYGGRYYALRSEAIEPKERVSPSTHGKTSKRRKTLEDSVYVPAVVVKDPPLTWAEWERLQERRAKNKLTAKRNASRTYLLRGMVYCEKHNRRFQGRKHRGGWHYTCPVAYGPGIERCQVPYLHGPWLEECAKEECRRILLEDHVIKGEILRRIGTFQTTREALEGDPRRLERKAADNITAETQLALELVRGRVSGEAYERALDMLMRERGWVQEETERVKNQLEAMNESQAALQGMDEPKG